MRYEKSVGARNITPEVWPQPAVPKLDATRDTLILFAHPRCPCSRASLEELNRILAGRSGQIAAHILFMNPSGVSNDWTQTSLRATAESIAPVSVANDPDGKIARQFGAETSGFVVLYSPEGKLLFSGGITAGRGQIGDNTSKSALLERVARRENDPVGTPVFGCSLQCSSTNQLPETTQ